MIVLPHCEPVFGGRVFVDLHVHRLREIAWVYVSWKLQKVWKNLWVVIGKTTRSSLGRKRDVAWWMEMLMLKMVVWCCLRLRRIVSQLVQRPQFQQHKACFSSISWIRTFCNKRVKPWSPSIVFTVLTGGSSLPCSVLLLSSSFPCSEARNHHRTCRWGGSCGSWKWQSLGDANETLPRRRDSSEHQNSGSVVELCHKRFCWDKYFPFDIKILWIES